MRMLQEMHIISIFFPIIHPVLFALTIPWTAVSFATFSILLLVEVVYMDLNIFE